MLLSIHLSLWVPLTPLTSSSPCSLDAAPTAVGAPGAPMSVKAYDVNADFVLVAWKPPNTVNEAAISGYFVDRSVFLFIAQHTDVDDMTLMEIIKSMT